MRTLRQRQLLAFAAALAAAIVDLLEKAVDGGAVHHPRSAAALALMLGVAAALVLVVPRLPSPLVALGAGIAAGGAIGNFVSGILWWGQGVPDPLVLRGLAGGIAFNLADVCVLLGDALLLAAGAVHALRHRERLRHPV